MTIGIGIKVIAKKDVIISGLEPAYIPNGSVGIVTKRFIGADCSSDDICDGFDIEWDQYPIGVRPNCGKIWAHKLEQFEIGSIVIIDTVT